MESLPEVDKDFKVSIGDDIPLKETREAFVQEYGERTLRKLFLLVIEMEGGSFSINFDHDKFVAISKRVNIILALFDFQRKLPEPLRNHIMLVLECNKCQTFCYENGEEIYLPDEEVKLT